MKLSAAASMLLFALFATAVGCGPAMGDVSGTVMMDGKPAPGVQVEFASAGDGASAVGFTDEQGNYTLKFPGRVDGAPPGDYIVRLTGVEREDAPGLLIPEKYNVASDLKRTVEAGSNDFDFEITSK
jgi:hypothetical protein